MNLSTLSEWLPQIKTLHGKTIDLGLERVHKVAERLGVLHLNCPLIIVGGTNGKGSTVAGLEQVYRQAGYQTGVFTTPILFKHNEQVRINGEMLSDEYFCQAFEKIEAARDRISLTPFEFHTLAALLICQQFPLDVLILEVGLGGRLDAVNILSADVAIVTNVAMDHMDYLGNTREAIGFEKAGIFRAHKIAICGESHPPESLLSHVQQLGSEFYCLEKNYAYQLKSKHWSWSNEAVSYEDLPYNVLLTQNMATVVMAITALQTRLPITADDLKSGLRLAQLPGRIEVRPGPIQTIFDVSHNPAAVMQLAAYLKNHACVGKTLAVFSMLADKAIDETITMIRSQIDQWFLAPLQTERAADMSEYLKNIASHHNNLTEAYTACLTSAQPGDRIIVFGSFHTVAEVQQCGLRF